MNHLTQHSIDAGSEVASNVARPIMKTAGAMSSKLSYLLIGGGIGAALALLFAPKAGTELRGDIASAAQKGYDSSLGMAQKMMDQSRDLYGSLKDKADGMTGGAASRLEDKVLNTASNAATDLPNGGGELLEGLSDSGDGGREKGSARASNTGF